MSTTKFSERRALIAAREWGELEALAYLRTYVAQHAALPPAPEGEEWRPWHEAFCASFSDSYPDGVWAMDFAWRKYREGWMYAYNYIKCVASNNGAATLPPETNFPEVYEVAIPNILDALANHRA